MYNGIRAGVPLAREEGQGPMRVLSIACVASCAALLCGCRHGSLAKSVARNQYKIVQGLLYSDSLVTDDGRSRLTGSVE
jgi:hypothetical protein